MKLIEFKSTIEYKKAIKIAGVGSMFSVSSDAKTKKGEALGFITAILYMQPSFKLCPASKSASCYDGCLNSAGRGAFPNVQAARKAKSDLFESDIVLFFSALVFEIEKLVAKHGTRLVVRLNGTSDIDYENYAFEYKGIQYANIFELFPNTQFYDYTKRCKRLYSELPENYDLTLSYSGARESYKNMVLEAMFHNNTRLAVVFAGELPSSFLGYPVIDGDSTDLRFLDSYGVVVGLKAKGKAKLDQSGFVVRASATSKRITLVEVA